MRNGETLENAKRHSHVTLKKLDLPSKFEQLSLKTWSFNNDDAFYKQNLKKISFLGNDFCRAAGVH